jgi:hypothetical protein
MGARTTRCASTSRISGAIMPSGVVGGVVTLIAVLTDTPPDVLTSTTYEYLVSCVFGRLRYVSEIFANIVLNEHVVMHVLYLGSCVFVNTRVTCEHCARARRCAQPIGGRARCTRRAARIDLIDGMCQICT